MTRSTFEQPLSAAWATNAACAHRGNGTLISGKWHTYPELAPDGLWTTPADLARFAIELQQSLRGESNKVISAESTNTNSSSTAKPGEPTRGTRSPWGSTGIAC